MGVCMAVYFNRSRQQWLYDFIINGKRYNSYCNDPATGEPAKTKKEAKDIETRIKANALAGHTAKRPNPKTYNLAQAFMVLMSIYKEGRQKENVKAYVKELLSYFGPSKPIKAINHTLILEYVAWAREQPIRYWTAGGISQSGPFPFGTTAADYWKTSDRKRSDSTINRYLSALGKALRLAHEDCDPETGIPLLPIMPKIPELKEPDILPRPIAPDDLEKMLAIAPAHLADAIRLTVLMGFRRSEVFGLTIDHVDFHQRGVWLSYDETKAYRDEFMPASEMAMELLERLVKQAKNVGQKHLILYRYTGKRRAEITEENRKDFKWKPIKRAQTAWENLLEKLGLTGKHVFHNTKATFVTAVAQEMPAAVVKDLARHKDFETTMRYIKVADKVRRKGVESVSGQLFSQMNTPTQNTKENNEPQKVTNEIRKRKLITYQGPKLTL